MNKSLIVRVGLVGSGKGIVSVDRPVASFAEAKYRTLKVCLLGFGKGEGGYRGGVAHSGEDDRRDR